MSNRWQQEQRPLVGSGAAMQHPPTLFPNTMKPGQDQITPDKVIKGSINGSDTEQKPPPSRWMIHIPLVILTLLIPCFLPDARPSRAANANLQEACALCSDCRLTENHDLQSPNHIFIHIPEVRSMPSIPTAFSHTDTVTYTILDSQPRFPSGTKLPTQS